MMEPSLILTVVGSIATLLGAIIAAVVGVRMKRTAETVGGDHADAAFKVLGAMNDRLAGRSGRPV